MRIYLDYVKGYGKSRSLIASIRTKPTRLEQKFLNKFDSVGYLNAIVSQTLSLDSFLVMPVSRLPRLKLLLREQIKIAEHLDEDPDQLKQLHRIYAGLSKHAEKINEEVNTFISSCSD
mmetsp:Transcript_15769/g.22124  ORF Transcript_15769/g.22124 Transcript_15769/m.22124 type:complete len:118 (+) Transcript_15769:652-1005(+)